MKGSEGRGGAGCKLLPGSSQNCAVLGASWEPLVLTPRWSPRGASPHTCPQPSFHFCFSAIYSCLEPLGDDVFVSKGKTYLSLLGAACKHIQCLCWITKRCTSLCTDIVSHWAHGLASEVQADLSHLPPIPSPTPTSWAPLCSEQLEQLSMVALRQSQAQPAGFLALPHSWKIPLS